MPPRAPARVVELRAQLGETLLDVQTLRPERSAAREPAPWLVAAILMMVAGLALFTAELSRVADPVGSGAPSPEGRSIAEDSIDLQEGARSGGDLGGLAAALLLLGVVPLGIAAHLRRERPADRYEIGEGRVVALPVAGATLGAGMLDERGAFTLVRLLGDQAVIRLSPAMRGELEDDAGVRSIEGELARGRGVLSLMPGARCALELGPLRFTIASVEATPLPPMRRQLDRGYWLSNLATATTAVGLALVGARLPSTPSPTDAEESPVQARIVEFLSESPPVEAAAPHRKRYKPIKGSPRREPVRPERKDAPVDRAPVVDEAGEIALPVHKAIKKRRRNRTAADDAREAGIFADDFAEAMEKTDAFIADSRKGLDAYGDDTARWAEMTTGPARHDLPGGLELARTRRGGGGMAEGAVDLDGRRVLAQVTGSGPRRTVSTGRPKVRGPLAADLIASTLRTLGPRLKSCHPAGALDRRAKLTLRFHVTEFGQVEEVTIVTNTHKGAVGRCVLGVARDWTFPPRAGRADTTVELPIHFGD